MGIRVKRGTQAQVDGYTAEEGEIVYATDTQKLYVDGTEIALSGGGGGTDMFIPSGDSPRIAGAPSVTGNFLAHTSEDNVFIGKNTSTVSDWLRLTNASNNYIVVANDGSGDYSTPSAAMTAASTGDVIFIKNTGAAYTNQSFTLKSEVHVISDFAFFNNTTNGDWISKVTTNADLIHNVTIFGLRCDMNNQGGSALQIDNSSEGGTNDAYSQRDNFNTHLHIENVEVRNAGSGTSGCNFWVSRVNWFKGINLRGYDCSDDNIHIERNIQGLLYGCYASGNSLRLGIHTHRGYYTITKGCFCELSQSDGYQYKGYNQSEDGAGLSSDWGHNLFLGCFAYKCGLRDPGAAGTPRGSGFYLNEPGNSYNSCIGCVAEKSGDAGYRVGQGDSTMRGDACMACYTRHTGWGTNDTAVQDFGETKGYYFVSGQEHIIMASISDDSGQHGIRLQVESSLAAYSVAINNRTETPIAVSGTSQAFDCVTS